MSDVTDLRDRLRAALKGALTARERTAVAALRSALAALDNAEAVPVPVSADGRGRARGPIAGAVGGVGAAEASRHSLSGPEALAIVRTQVAERLVAADEYDRLGRPEPAERLRQQAGVLVTVLPA